LPASHVSLGNLCVSTSVCNCGFYPMFPVFAPARVGCRVVPGFWNPSSGWGAHGRGKVSFSCSFRSVPCSVTCVPRWFQISNGHRPCGLLVALRSVNMRWIIGPREFLLCQLISLLVCVRSHPRFRSKMAIGSSGGMDDIDEGGGGGLILFMVILIDWFGYSDIWSDLVGWRSLGPPLPT